MQKNLPYLPESPQLSQYKHNKGWKMFCLSSYLPAYLPASTAYLPAVASGKLTIFIFYIL